MNQKYYFALTFSACQGPHSGDGELPEHIWSQESAQESSLVSQRPAGWSNSHNTLHYMYQHRQVYTYIHDILYCQGLITLGSVDWEIFV